MRTDPRVCCDANLIVKGYDPRTPEYSAIIGLFETWARDRVTIIAPSSIRFEITNALYRATRAGTMESEYAHQILVSLESLPIQYSNETGFLFEALDIARILDSKTSYDAYYVALARREGILLHTADRRLANASRGRFSFVRYVMDE